MSPINGNDKNASLPKDNENMTSQKKSGLMAQLAPLSPF